MKRAFKKIKNLGHVAMVIGSKWHVNGEVNLK
jgi:hypothetical protein